MIERVLNKVIISGDIVEIYEYEIGYLKGYKLKESSGGRIKDYESQDYQENREKVLKRAKRDLRRLINANVGMYGKQYTTKFLTLTFGDNVTDLEQANYEFEKFKKRLNYLIWKTKKAKLKYSVVIEFQKRGAIHYHMLIYNMPFVKQKIIEETWGNGYVWINKIDEVDNVGAYVAEYLGDSSKSQGKEKEDSRLKGKKSYFNSRGLFKPVEVTDKKIVDELADSLPFNKLRYSNTFENEHLGVVHYRQYILND